MAALALPLRSLGRVTVGILCGCLVVGPLLAEGFQTLSGEQATRQEETAVIEQVVAGKQGVRLRSSSKIHSVSGRLDFRGRVVVTVVGQGLAVDQQRFLGEQDLYGLDGSGLLSSLTLEPTVTGSGLALVTAVLETRSPVVFRVAAEGNDVVVSLEEREGPRVGRAEAARDATSGRRVLTAADLEPVPAKQTQSGMDASGAKMAGSVDKPTGRAEKRQRLVTVSRVNLRPTPTLDSVPLMVLPKKTPLEGIGWRGNWRHVALGELEGWVDASFLGRREEPDEVGVASAATIEERRSVESQKDEALDPGQPGSWLERLAESGTYLPETPSWDGPPQLLSAEELVARERALREATGRELETSQQDLRVARAELAELRIDLARAHQRLEEVEAKLRVAETTVMELEAQLPTLRDGAVQARAELERSEAARRAVSDQLDASEKERLRLQALSTEWQQERQQRRAQALSLQVEVDGLRQALRQAEAELASPSPQAVVVPVEDEERVAIESMLESWARAWSEKDLEAYLDFYSSSFRPAQLDRSSWTRIRRERLTQPEWVEVEIGEIGIDARAPGTGRQRRVRVTFQQSYRSPNYQDVVEKVLVLRLDPAGWRIVEEGTVQPVSVVSSVQ